MSANMEADLATVRENLEGALAAPVTAEQSLARPVCRCSAASRQIPKKVAMIEAHLTSAAGLSEVICRNEHFATNSASNQFGCDALDAYAVRVKQRFSRGGRHCGVATKMVIERLIRNKGVLIVAGDDSNESNTEPIGIVFAYGQKFYAHINPMFQGGSSSRHNEPAWSLHWLPTNSPALHGVVLVMAMSPLRSARDALVVLYALRFLAGANERRLRLPNWSQCRMWMGIMHVPLHRFAVVALVHRNLTWLLERKSYHE